MRPLLTLAALLALASQTASAGTLDRIRETGVFRIGYRADARPYSYQDRNGQPAGYIVDLCSEVAAALGPNIHPQYVRVPADRVSKRCATGMSTSCAIRVQPPCLAGKSSTSPCRHSSTARA